MKTRVGKLLADALRYYFFDSDNLVVEATGGEAAAKQLLDMDKVGFRESETEIFRQLSSMGCMVVSAGCSLKINKFATFETCISIWVDVPLDMVAKEIIENRVRLIGSNISPSSCHSEVLAVYKEMKEGYSIAY